MKDSATDGVPDPNEASLGSSWQDFKRTYPTESACVDEIYALLIAQGRIKCSTCGSCEHEREAGKRWCKCSKCRATIWITAGTMFERAHKLRAWFGTIWLMESGVPISGNRLAQLLGIAQSSAWALLQRMSTLVLKSMENQFGEISTTHFMAVMRKRSSETEARQHPVSEELEVQKKLAGATSVPSDEDDQLLWDDDERAVFAVLTYDFVPFDEVCSLTGLPSETVGASLCTLKMGKHVVASADAYARAKKKSQVPLLAKLTKVALGVHIDAIANHICEIYSGISRKHLQKYIAAYWSVEDRKRWSRGTILQACLSSEPISIRDLREYVSPPEIYVSFAEA